MSEVENKLSFILPIQSLKLESLKTLEIYMNSSVKFVVHILCITLMINVYDWTALYKCGGG